MAACSVFWPWKRILRTEEAELPGPWIRKESDTPAEGTEGGALPVGGSRAGPPVLATAPRSEAAARNRVAGSALRAGGDAGTRAGRRRWASRAVPATPACKREKRQGRLHGRHPAPGAAAPARSGGGGPGHSLRRDRPGRAAVGRSVPGRPVLCVSGSGSRVPVVEAEARAATPGRTGVGGSAPRPHADGAPPALLARRPAPPSVQDVRQGSPGPSVRCGWLKIRGGGAAPACLRASKLALLISRKILSALGVVSRVLRAAGLAHLFPTEAGMRFCRTRPWRRWPQPPAGPRSLS